MLELLPLLDDVHALGVDEAVAVDPAQAHVRRSLHVGRLQVHNNQHVLMCAALIMWDVRTSFG